MFIIKVRVKGRREIFQSDGEAIQIARYAIANNYRKKASRQIGKEVKESVGVSMINKKRLGPFYTFTNNNYEIQPEDLYNKPDAEPEWDEATKSLLASLEISSIDLGDGITLKMVWIEGGTFQMGAPEAEVNSRDDERPVHPVELNGFWMGQFEVTQAQYEKVLGENPSRFKRANKPVENAAWNDAKRFCVELSKQTGQRFTLPTEAQWEYACRAGGAEAYGFGDWEGQLGEHAWYKSNSSTQTHLVGMRKVNAWGLFDMHGNISEWCRDWYDADFYNNDRSKSKNPVNELSADQKVARGGSWSSNPGTVRSATRLKVAPDTAIHSIGFRVVKNEK